MELRGPKSRGSSGTRAALSEQRKGQEDRRSSEKGGAKAEEKALPEGAATGAPRSRAAPARAADPGLRAMT